MTDALDPATTSDPRAAAPEQPPSAPTPTASSGTRGFLFSDLRGYTAFVERAGDQAAAELLDRYRTLVRGVIAAHDGAEIRTEGDSVYVVFGNASAAVEAGLEIVSAAAEQSTRERPIRVGVGIHAGETVATTEGLVGGAVNIAARVCAKAQSGEVLVTDTVRALTRTFLPYRYTSLGTQQLKGIAGGIPLYRVELTQSTTRARLRRQLSARRGRVALVVGLIVVLLAVGAGLYAANRAPDCLSLPASTKDVVAKIDPSRNCVVATYPVGQRPGPIVATMDAIWVGNVDDWTLSRVDPKTGHTIQTGIGGSPVDIAVDTAGNAFVLTLLNRAQSGAPQRVPLDWVAKVNARSNQLQAFRVLPVVTKLNTYGSGSGYSGLTFFGGRTWVSNQLDGNVTSLAGGLGGDVTIPVELSGGATLGSGNPASQSAATGPIDAGSGVVWVANLSDAKLYRLDGAAGKPASLNLDGAAGSTAIDATDSAVWLTRADGQLTRYDPSAGSVTSFPIGGGPTDLVATQSGIWVADKLKATISRVDSDSGGVMATLNLGGRPGGLAAGSDGSIWVTIQGP